MQHHFPSFALRGLFYCVVSGVLRGLLIGSCIFCLKMPVSNDCCVSFLPSLNCFFRMALVDGLTTVAFALTAGAVTLLHDSTGQLCWDQ